MQVNLRQNLNLMQENEGDKYFKQVSDMQHPDWVADQFVIALGKSVPLREAITARIVACLQDDQEARKAIKTTLREIDKEFTSTKYRQLFIWVGGLVSLILSTIALELLRRWLFGSE
jgi:hypothetical protein